MYNKGTRTAATATKAGAFDKPLAGGLRFAQSKKGTEYVSLFINRAALGLNGEGTINLIGFYAKNKKSDKTPDVQLYISDEPKATVTGSAKGRTANVRAVDADEETPF